MPPAALPRLTPSGEGPYWFCRRMGNDEQKPLTDRIKEKLSELVDELLAGVESIVRPPKLIPIPVRKPYRR